MDQSYIKEVIKQVVMMLIDKRYQEIYDNDVEKQIKPEEIEEALEGYGSLTIPPEGSFNVEVYEQDDPAIVFVNCDLWFNGERGDLTLQVVVYDSDNKYAIRDLHML